MAKGFVPWKRGMGPGIWHRSAFTVAPELFLFLVSSGALRGQGKLPVQPSWHQEQPQHGTVPSCGCCSGAVFVLQWGWGFPVCHEPHSQQIQSCTGSSELNPSPCSSLGWPRTATTLPLFPALLYSQRALGRPHERLSFRNKKTQKTNKKGGWELSSLVLLCEQLSPSGSKEQFPVLGTNAAPAGNPGALPGPDGLLCSGPSFGQARLHPAVQRSAQRAAQLLGLWG